MSVRCPPWIWNRSQWGRASRTLVLSLLMDLCKGSAPTSGGNGHICVPSVAPDALGVQWWGLRPETGLLVTLEPHLPALLRIL